MRSFRVPSSARARFAPFRYGLLSFYEQRYGRETFYNRFCGGLGTSDSLSAVRSGSSETVVIFGPSRTVSLASPSESPVRVIRPSHSSEPIFGDRPRESAVRTGRKDRPNRLREPSARATLWQSRSSAVWSESNATTHPLAEQHCDRSVIRFDSHYSLTPSVRTPGRRRRT